MARNIHIHVHNTMDIKKGSEKIVILCEKYAIKFPKFGKKFVLGVISMIEEPYIWYKYKDPRLAPVIFFIPFFMIIQKKATPMKKTFFIENRELIKEIFTGAPFHVDLENQEKNFGRVNRDIVLVDYNTKLNIQIRKILKKIFPYLVTKNKNSTRND